jgi:hypothetical protein
MPQPPQDTAPACPAPRTAWTRARAERVRRWLAWWTTVLLALLTLRVQAATPPGPAAEQLRLEVGGAGGVASPLTAEPLRARRVLGARNFESTARREAGLKPTVEPWEEPALLRMQPPGGGQVVVEVGGQEMARAQAWGNGPVLLTVPPGREPRQPLRVRFEPQQAGAPRVEVRLELATTLADAGALAAGQTFLNGAPTARGG